MNFLVIAVLVIGIITGAIFKNNKNVLSAADKITPVAIYLLLFLLGLSAGSNTIVTESFGELGKTAIILTIGGITGSVILSYLVYILVFRSTDK